LAFAYTSAVGASIGVGLCVKKLLSPFESSFKGSRKFFFTFLIAFIANSSANAANLFCVRRGEFTNGIPVLSKDGKEMGISKVAGRTAVIQTAFSRAIMPVLPLFVPTISFYYLTKLKMMPKNRGIKMAVETLVFLAALIYAPPMACAIFPQLARAPVTKLESEFQNLTDERGRPITELFYNKGL
jgi:hypothetical protein